MALRVSWEVPSDCRPLYVDRGKRSWGMADSQKAKKRMIEGLEERMDRWMLITNDRFEVMDREFTKACMPFFFEGLGGQSGGRKPVQARRERELERSKQDRAAWIREQRKESARNAEQDKRELREARAAKIAGVATKKQLLIIQLTGIKEAFKE